MPTEKESGTKKPTVCLNLRKRKQEFDTESEESMYKLILTIYKVISRHLQSQSRVKGGCELLFLENPLRKVNNVK
jgi:hypothetical protein